MVMCAGLVKVRRIFKYKEVNMGLFSKEECCFCGAKVGVLSRFKIKSGEFMCQDCQKKGNPFMHLASMNKDEIGLLFEECEQGEAKGKAEGKAAVEKALSEGLLSEEVAKQLISMMEENVTTN